MDEQGKYSRDLLLASHYAFSGKPSGVGVCVMLGDHSSSSSPPRNKQTLPECPLRECRNPVLVEKDALTSSTL